jgi:hypothetical protein
MPIAEPIPASNAAIPAPHKASAIPMSIVKPAFQAHHVKRGG